MAKEIFLRGSKEGDNNDAAKRSNLWTHSAKTKNFAFSQEMRKNGIYV